MEVIKTDIDGVVIIEPTIFGDSRGYFYESFNALQFEAKTGVCSLRLLDGFISS